jgi:hypothetical protein
MQYISPNDFSYVFQIVNLRPPKQIEEGSRTQFLTVIQMTTKEAAQNTDLRPSDAKENRSRRQFVTVN